MKSLLILGAGGFGRMVAETAQALGYEKVVFLDDAVKDEQHPLAKAEKCIWK